MRCSALPYSSWTLFIVVSALPHSMVLASDPPITPPAQVIAASKSEFAGLMVSNLEAPVLGEDGHVAVQANFNDQTIRWGVAVRQNGNSFILGREGDAVPDGNGVFGIADELEAAGASTVFEARATGTADAPLDSDGIYYFDGSTLSTIARSNDGVPDGTGVFNTFSFGLKGDNSGDVAFQATVVNLDHAAERVYFKPSAGPLRLLVGEKSQGIVTLLDDWTFNSSGQLATGAYTGVALPGIFLNDGLTAGFIAQNEQRLPEDDGTYTFFSGPAIDEAGDVAYVAAAQRDVAPAGINRLYLYSKGATQRIFQEGDAAPQGGTFGYLGTPEMNNDGQLAFNSLLTDGRSGIYRRDPDGQVFLIARSDLPAPDGIGMGNGTFGRLSPAVNYFPHSFDGSYLRLPPAINNNGDVAFLAYPTIFNDTPAIYIGDPGGSVLVARAGDQLAGSTIADFVWPGANQSGSNPPIALNDNGQVAYTAQLADGRRITQLFTPTLRWRGGGHGSWDDARNWTLGIEPAGVHPVVLGAASGTKITGPAGVANVQSLKIQDGNTLDLIAGSTISAIDGVVIDPGAGLAGNGTIAANVANNGEVNPGDSLGAITIIGNYQQTGDLDLQLMDSDSDRLTITGDAALDGDIFVRGGPASFGKTFDLITIGGALMGSATWHIDGPGSTWQTIVLPDGDHVLQVHYVPEPSAVCAIAPLGMMLALRRRSKFRSRIMRPAVL